MHKNDIETLIKAGYSPTILKLKGYKHDEHLPLKAFIKNFLVEYNQNYDTIRLDGLRQTYAGRLRSLGDIFRITSYYYPGVRLEEVFKTLKSFDDLVGHICSDIKRRVYITRQAKGGWVLLNADEKDEFGYDIIDTNSRYIESWVSSFKV